MNTTEFYEKNGYAIIEKAISEDLIDLYEKKWLEENGDNFQGWDGHTSYLDHPEILDILCHKNVNDFFMDAQKGVALHLNLTYWVSTEKGWHMDATIPNKLGSDNYTGAWVALENISPDSGPFQLIPGSHLWDIDLNEMIPLLEDGKACKEFLEKQIKKNNGEIVTFNAKKGDILFWHGRLIHRGSTPKNRNVTRKSLIGHYCNMYANELTQGSHDLSDTLEKLNQMTDVYARWNDGAYYFSNPDKLKCPPKKK
jgi:hypothetical protein